MRIREASASELLLRCRNELDAKTGGLTDLQDKLKGYLFTTWAASGIKVARTWSRLLCGTWEPVVPMLREKFKWRTLKNESTDAGHGGGMDGLDVLSAPTILAEVGLNPDAFPSEKHFASWLGLCPDNWITGGKIKSSKTRKVVNRAANAFRLTAQTMHHSASALGGYYRVCMLSLAHPKQSLRPHTSLSVYFIDFGKPANHITIRGLITELVNENETPP